MVKLSVALGLLVAAFILLLIVMDNPGINGFLASIVEYITALAISWGSMGLLIFSFITTTPLLPIVAPELIYPIYAKAGMTAWNIILISSVGVALWMLVGYAIGKWYSDRVDVNDRKLRKYLKTYGYTGIAVFMVFPLLPIPIELAAGVAALDIKKYMAAVFIGAAVRAAAILGLLGSSVQWAAYNATPLGL